MDNSLKLKIEHLFEKRCIQEQVYNLRICDAQALMEMLKELQLAIYHLDKYFEQKWDLRSTDIKACWIAVMKSLQEVVDKSQHLEELVQDIRAYQKVEESLRNPLWLRLPSLSEFYRLKTCDVRLSRNIIASHATDYKDQTRDYLNQWELFDLVSEILDDLYDVDEDLGTYNGNRFLLGINTIGIDATFHEYNRFIFLLNHRAYILKSGLGKGATTYGPIELTCQCLVELRELLRIRKENIRAIATSYSKNALMTARRISGNITATSQIREVA